LKDVWQIEREATPFDTMRATLESYGRLAPDDDRVWLGLGRLAIREGRWEEAAGWLRRCLERRPDPPVWRTWLEWARGADRPDEVLRAYRNLGPKDHRAAERLATRAWLARSLSDEPRERQLLAQLLAIEPRDPTALERAAVLAQNAGDVSQAAELRRRKTEVDEALLRYRPLLLRDRHPADARFRAAIGQVAEAAGRPLDALVWYGLAVRGSGKVGEAGLARVAQGQSASRAAAAAVVEDQFDDLAALVARKGSTVRAVARAGRPDFVDAADSAGLRFVYENGQTSIHQLPERMGGGLAIFDYDGDGWLDVYAVQGGRFSSVSGRGGSGDRLYRNRGDGTFQDATETTNLGGCHGGYGHGVTIGDYDNDGWPDVFVTRFGLYALYRNQGDGSYEDVTEPSGLAGARGWPTSAAFADLDGDGDLDLYVCHYVAWDAANPRICRDARASAYISCNPLLLESEPDRLYRNDGGRFVDVSAEAGIADRTGRGLGVLAADLDGDDRVDLYVANDMTANFLWRNRGEMQFEEIGHQAGVAANASGGYQAGMGIACGDLDRDGRVDLAVTNFYGESTSFFRNLGQGLFCDDSRAVGLAGASRQLLGFGVVFLDFNNDGYLDLASANGHVDDFRPHFPYEMRAQLLAGSASGRLDDISDRAGAPWKRVYMGRGLAAGDLNHDGRTDLALLAHNRPLVYMENRSEAGHFLDVILEGTASNRDAVGARVAVWAGGMRQVAVRFGGGSYQSASDRTLHIGLGTMDRIDVMEVRWPSGRTDRFEGLRADACYWVSEGRSGSVRVAAW
jgi:hypothetical protein